VEVGVALVPIAHEDEVVPVVAAARHAGVLARLVLTLGHAQVAVEPLRNLGGGQGRRENTLVYL